MHNTQIRLETPLDVENTNNIMDVTVVTYRSFLDGDFKTYYRIEDGRDEPREYHLSDCITGIENAEAEHNKHCERITKALEAIEMGKVSELWDAILQLRNSIFRLKYEVKE